ncbi:IS200/IS605 family element transposase accessory protein TnpB [Moraxella osloensis]|uniref:IS200/IS605 family element transposase accessory protein TnpB n=1 Tax=Faucicola osloensis TaxID=34062 RepID=A0A6P1KJI7_FAUOS|nr:RNA-guided endonuclease TnpB family protein [Moraxella osloensis]QHG08504.1 IS200/IS605 family element transposase accessory protein TnpB [Moraxella osloensis]QHG08674.1 IS200/IS605 family element transposase accessory protein TnpB [Moraxella osloensis]
MKTLKLRIRDKHADQLNRLSGSVNFVWNYVNDLSYRHLQKTGKFFSAYDLNDYTKGSGELLGLHSQTIQAINETHTKSRRQSKKAKLSWRTNNPKSKRKNLGWLPFKQSAIKHIATHQTGKKGLKSTLQLSLAKGQKLVIDLWDSYNLSLYQINTLEIVQDSRNRWYACITVKQYPKTTCGMGSVGIDLGLKDSATASNGDKLQIKQTLKYAKALATAQRAKNKQRVKAIHAKIKHTRQDLIHKFTTQLVKDNALIVVGDVRTTQFNSKKGKLAKSVYDAGWFELKRQLTYKCENAGCRFEIVNEKYTTQTCSCCGDMSSSPKGRAGLRIREWTCATCGTRHDRDINASKNILAVGLNRLVEGIPSL